jgi:hypothetical protein
MVTISPALHASFPAVTVPEEPDVAHPTLPRAVGGNSTPFRVPIALFLVQAGSGWTTDVSGVSGAPFTLPLAKVRARTS